MKRVFAAINNFIRWLGTARTRTLFLLFAGTGLLSLILNAAIRQNPAQASQIALVQSGLLVLFLVGAVLTVISRFDQRDRWQIAVLIIPSLVAAALAILFPNLALLFLPIAIGWIILGSTAFRSRVRKEYQTAIKAMRKRDYPAAIRVISELIDAEPKNADHVRFRAELYRLSGKSRRAREDYQRVVNLTPDSAIGHNGLAEVYLQDGDYEGALPFAYKALSLAPNQWIAPYNLGMIEDRLARSADAVTHLEAALKVGIPDSRHRVLTYLWLARAAMRDAMPDAARGYISKLKREKSGLQEWATIFQSEEAQVLKTVLANDIALAEKVAESGDPAMLNAP